MEFSILYTVDSVYEMLYHAIAHLVKYFLIFSSFIENRVESKLFFVFFVK
jgi:hypothetical protein